MRTNETKEKKRIKIGDVITYLVLSGIVLFFVGMFLYLLVAVFAGVFGEKHYVKQENYIYGMWQNRYYEERTSGKGVSTTKEINRYYYKTKSGNTYHDNWTTYDISDITVVNDTERELIVIERLRYKNEFFDEHFESTSSEGKPKTKAHYFVHKDTARKLGIAVY